MKNKMLFFIMTVVVATVLISRVPGLEFVDRFLMSGTSWATTCTYTLTPPNQVVGPEDVGGYGTNVSTEAKCQWTAVSNVPWLKVYIGHVGYGNGRMEYFVDANEGPNPRRGTITIAGKTFTVSQASLVQAPCRITVPSGAVVSGVRFLGRRFSITTSTETCRWEVQTFVPWITLRSRPSGNGSIIFVYDIEENNGPLRAGRILVNGKHFTVTQRSR